MLQLVNEFLSEQKQNLAPATFNMNSLLKEMQEIEDVRMREAPQRGEGSRPPQSALYQPHFILFVCSLSREAI